jgi:GDP-L-fucose synthase
MKVLVTGSNGLVGNAFKKILGEGHIYHTREEVDLFDEIKFRDYLNHQIKFNGVDTVIHCAAKVGGVGANSTNNKGFFYENYIINKTVLKSAFELEIPNFVNLLSTCVFPDTNIFYPLTSDQIDNGRPHTSNEGYSYAKRLSGYETNVFRNFLQKNWISVVPTNVYGPHDNFNLEHSHIIPGMIHRAHLAKQKKEKMVIWGDGSPLRQFIHSEDLAKNILWAIDNWKFEKYFQAINENEISVMEVAQLIIKRFGFDQDDLVFDASKPKGQFRKPAKTDIPENYNFIDFENGINNTIDWFEKNYNTLRK